MPTVLPRELHTTERPSSTAQATAIGRVLERHRPRRDRIVDDPYAARFLTTVSRTVTGALRAAGPVWRQAERSALGAISVSVLCRHRFIDEHFVASLPDVSQVVILGAGYDSRAYRFADAIGNRPVFEVDLAPLSRRKAAIVGEHPDAFGRTAVRRVEIDFRTDSLLDLLVEAGLAVHEPLFVVWEGVSMYLDRDAVDRTLATLKTLCGRGSVLAMDFWQHVNGSRSYELLRRAGERSFRVAGEPLTFDLPARDVDALLADHGFEVTDLAEARDATARYATAGRHCDPGMYTIAARRP